METLSAWQVRSGPGVDSCMHALEDIDSDHQIGERLVIRQTTEMIRSDAREIGDSQVERVVDPGPHTNKQSAAISNVKTSRESLHVPVDRVRQRSDLYVSATTPPYP